jgi:hypothetical protein
VVNQTIKQYGAAEMSIALVEHPIAGLSQDEVNKKVEKEFPTIKTAIEWQPK